MTDTRQNTCLQSISFRLAAVFGVPATRGAGTPALFRLLRWDYAGVVLRLIGIVRHRVEAAATLDLPGRHLEIISVQSWLQLAEANAP